MNIFFLLKSIHFFGFVSWFAGLFYLGRLFVYHRETASKEEPEKSILFNQFHRMQKRVYQIIIVPAMVITLIGGFGMLTIQTSYFQQPWMQVKLLLILALLIYQWRCKRIIKELYTHTMKLTSFQFRLWNEVPTILLLSVVLLAVYKNALNGFLCLHQHCTFCNRPDNIDKSL